MQQELLTKELERWNSETMRMDFSPAHWTCEKPTYHDLTEVHLTYGGGMGGSHRTLYIKETRNILTPHTLIEVTNFFTDEVETINTDFMVFAKDVIIASVTYETSNEHIKDSNRYHCDRFGNGTIYKIVDKSLKDKITLLTR